MMRTAAKTKFVVVLTAVTSVLRVVTSMLRFNTLALHAETSGWRVTTSVTPRPSPEHMFIGSAVTGPAAETRSAPVPIVFAQIPTFLVASKKPPMKGLLKPQRMRQVHVPTVLANLRLHPRRKSVCIMRPSSATQF